LKNVNFPPAFLLITDILMLAAPAYAEKRTQGAGRKRLSGLRGNG